jgi:hypothetical protein
MALAAGPQYDKPDQLERIKEGLLEGENVLAVYDCIGAGTGFVGLTDLRVILQDNSFVGKKVALTSVPYSRVQAVSFVSKKSMLGQVVVHQRDRHPRRRQGTRVRVPGP